MTPLQLQKSKKMQDGAYGITQAVLNWTGYLPPPLTFYNPSTRNEMIKQKINDCRNIIGDIELLGHTKCDKHANGKTPISKS